MVKYNPSAFVSPNLITQKKYFLLFEANKASFIYRFFTLELDGNPGGHRG